MILVDTSVWVGHLRAGDGDLAELLRSGDVVCHPFVVGELARGRMRSRGEILTLLSALPVLPKADDAEALDFISRHRLMGRGLGPVDVHLLASCMLADAPLWTLDRKLQEAATDLGLARNSKGT